MTACKQDDETAKDDSGAVCNGLFDTSRVHSIDGAADAAARIDASGITISDMGSHMGGQGGPGSQGDPNSQGGPGAANKKTPEINESQAFFQTVDEAEIGICRVPA